MWSRFTSVLKPKEAQSSQSEIINKVHEQHPNMSMFQANETGVIESPPDLPPSPSVHNKKSMFKRMSRNALNDADLRAQMPAAGPPALPAKGKGPMGSNGNGSQEMLGNNATEPRRSQDIPRRSSYDMLRPSPEREKRAQDTTRSVKEIRRPSIDFLRQDTSRPSSPHIPEGRRSTDFLATPGADKFSSTRSILRDKNTPGTGQNVRFNGNDAFKVITPDQSQSQSMSMSMDLQSKAQPPIPQDENPFMARLTEANSSNDSPQPIGKSHSSSNSRSLHPSLGDIFAPLNDQPPATSTPDQSDMSMSSFNHFVVEGNSNLFNVSQQLDIPAFPPPGLGFDVNAPMFEEPSDHEHSQLLADGGLMEYAEHFTSTPYRKEEKGKGKEQPLEQFPVELPSAPKVIDETIFHSQERSPKMPGPLHERSHSFSAGQTLFYSVGNSGHKSNKSSPDSSAAYPSSDLKPESINTSNSVPTPPSSNKITRSRAMSDTVFQTMLKAKPASAPEADINDESSSGLVVYSAGQSEPDPFSANANTYYTPQTMIPTTPPKGTLRHNRKTSKEESIIMSLQTELSLKTELCAQYETDLKARDEMVEILNTKLADFEKDEAKRKAALRSWKKKVQELERACRLLEEAVEDSRQESMERSIMDEASGEALRMLHRQIASLEREKQEWARREAALQEDVQTLEGLVKERTDEVQRLHESLWAHDESERELRHGIRAAKEQIDMMGNISVGVIDEEDMKKLLAEREQKSAEDTQRFRTVEFELRQEVEEWQHKYDNLSNEKAKWEERLEHAENMLRIRDEEYSTLKAELDAQWERTEADSEKYAALVRERDDIMAERDNMQAGMDEVEAKMAQFEAEWANDKDRVAELEAELEEAAHVRKELEDECNELRDQLRDAHDHIEHLAQDIEERDQHLAQLEEEHQFSTENISRLQTNLKQRDEEIAQHLQRVRERQDEIEHLREEMSGLKREHNHLLNEQSRVLDDVTGRNDFTQAQLEDIVRAKADLELELKMTKDQLQKLESEKSRNVAQLNHLKTDSANQEVKLIQLTKQYTKLQEDFEQQNIALDSKQQELELIKRKFGARGTAGATPAPGSKIPHHRRDSSVFSARPESALSDSGTDSTSTTIKKKSSLDTASGIVSSRVAAFAKSNKTNSIGSSNKFGRPSVDGSMAPPANMKPRSSLSSGTPTQANMRSGLSRSSSIGTPVSPTQMRTPTAHRKVSSVSSGDQVRAKLSKAPSTPRTVPEQIEEEEKENIDTSGISPGRRRSLVPASG